MLPPHTGQTPARRTKRAFKLAYDRSVDTNKARIFIFHKHSLFFDRCLSSIYQDISPAFKNRQTPAAATAALDHAH